MTRAILGVEEAWDAMATSSGLTGAGTEPVRDAPSSVARSPPAVAEQAPFAVVSTVGVALGRFVQAW